MPWTWILTLLVCVFIFIFILFSFFGHFFTVYVAYYLGVHSDVEGRDLISIAAKNPWWSQRNIELHPKCVDIPQVLKG